METVEQRPDCAVCGLPYHRHNVGVITTCPIIASYRPKEALPPSAPDRDAADSWQALLAAIDVWANDPSAEAEQLILDARAALAIPPSGIAEAWQDISTAPTDGTVFIARNGDHPSFGSWPMLRRVRHVVESGEFRCIDLGAWFHVLDIEPDYDNGDDTPEQVTVPFAIASDDMNKSVRYEWRPFPEPPRALDLSDMGGGK